MEGVCVSAYVYELLYLSFWLTTKVDILSVSVALPCLRQLVPNSVQMKEEETSFNIGSLQIQLHRMILKKKGGTTVLFGGQHDLSHLALETLLHFGVLFDVVLIKKLHKRSS